MDNKHENKAISKIKKKQKKERRHTQFYYSFLTIVLFVCFIQMSFSAILNITKVIAYHRKICTLESKQIAAEAKNTELKKDYKNIVLIDGLKEEFIEEGLIQELIDLYNMEFYYTENPKVLEKIGDIYFNQKDYEAALNSYFDCAEISEDYPEIYGKLAQTFGVLNDEKSKAACLEQMELLSKKSD